MSQLPVFSVRSSPSDVAGRHAFGLLLQQYRPVVRSICLQRLGGVDHEDLVQEVFLRAYRSRARLDDVACFLPYLCKIAHNLCTDRIRGRRRSGVRRLLSLEELESEPVDRAEPVDPDAWFWRARLAAELGRLPARQREVVRHFHFGGMSYAETAAAMGVTIAAVNQLLSRARSQLRSAFALRRLA